MRAFTTDPYLLYYDLGHRTGSPVGTVDGFRNRLLTMKSDYVIVTATSRSGEAKHLNQLVNELSQRCAKGLSLVAGNVDSGYAVYKTDLPRLERPESCAREESLPEGDFGRAGAVLILKVDNTRKRYDVRIFVRFLGR